MSDDTSTRVVSRWKGGLPVIAGFLGVGLLAGVLGGWGVYSRISGAIVASGIVEVENKRQVIQHPDGGVIREILSKDGDEVNAGDIVIRMDGTFLQSEMTIIEEQLFELVARRSRLEAERDRSNHVQFPENLNRIADQEPFARKSIEIQRQLFWERQNTYQAELEQIDKQKEQLANQIVGIDSEMKARRIQLDLIIERRKSNENLFKRQIISAERMSEIRIEEANIQGILGKLEASIAEIKAQIASLKVQELKLVTSYREKSIDGLSELSVRESELTERRNALQEQLSRLDVRAPVDGKVFGSAFFAVKSVVQAAAPLMYIVPQNQPLIVTSRVDSIHIDQLYLGQKAALRFLSFDQRWTPEISGTVSNIAADIIQDESTGQTFYQVELIPEVNDLPKLEGQVLLSGMPVEVFIKTGERSPLSYLTKPIADYFTRAMREN